jgi:DNA (cytosine-5)-methyltransferase 1
MAEAGTDVYTSVEICAGAGGQAIGFHKADFVHRALIEIDADACNTLEENIGHLGGDKSIVHRLDLKLFSLEDKKSHDSQFSIVDLGLNKGEIDLLSGGVPCPPFSLAGKQLGEDDDRDLFPVMLEMAEALDPKAIMIENVRGLLQPPEKFEAYRSNILERLRKLGYAECWWDVLEAQNFGVPQLRPRAILVALKEEYAPHFAGLPMGDPGNVITARSALHNSMLERFDALRETKFRDQAEEARKRWLAPEGKIDVVAPTLVGGSKKHGGADLGPTRAKQVWANMGVNAMGVADENPLDNPGRHLLRWAGPMLTVKQAARIQGFPSYWEFQGRKTAAYRQVGNAFPPPVAEAVGKAIMAALKEGDAATRAGRPQDSSVVGEQSQATELVPV